MSRRLDIKKIQKEDFEADMQDTIEKLAFPINSFMEQTRNALDGNIDFNNLNEEIITLDISVNASGIPIVITKYVSNIRTRVIGHNVISVVSVNNPQTVFATNQPFINYTQNANLVTINNITGLPANERFRLTVRSIGASTLT
jgi:hypothetical protein